MEKNKTLANLLKMPKITIGDLFGVTVGSFIAAVAIRLFLDPWDIVPGGVSGLSMGVERLTNKLIYMSFGDNVPLLFVWIKNILTIQWLNLIFNVPLFIFGA